MIDFEQKESYGVKDLEEIVRLLRAPGGCPWDQEQNHKSIRRNLIEEAYEVAEAIDEEDVAHLKEELGDLLLQVVFHARMEEETGGFCLDDVADGICKKLIYRHPHVFGDVSVDGSGEVLENWETLKRKEKQQKTAADSVDAVAKSLPALWRAEKIQEKARKAGFDWEDISGALEKVEEELGEIKRALKGDGNAAEEVGDLLFAAVNVARFVKADPEQALGKTSDKFARRFRMVEQGAARQGRAMEEMTLAELDSLWEEAKAQEQA